MKDILRLSTRLGILSPPTSDLNYLSELHHSHFYSIPFENLSMHENARLGLNHSVISEAIIENRRGGICFEFSTLIDPIFDQTGFIYRTRLARLLIPAIMPATHQIYIISIDKQDWLFDVGFGAKGPRGLLLLRDGFEHNHPFLSSRISKSAKWGWVISVKENTKLDSIWEDAYAFHDIETTASDIEMAHFYTLHSPKSLLNTNKVASLPTEEGRISIRNNTFTEVRGHLIEVKEITCREDMSNLLRTRFDIEIDPEKLTYL